MYLEAIIDLKTRFIVGWFVSNNISAEWCSEILKTAIENGKPEIFNIDKGSQFTSEIFIEMLKIHKIEISMDGKGKTLINIFIERFWKNVKYENIYLYVYENGTDLYNGLNKYFSFYNNQRINQSLDYETPIQVYNGAA
jgi:putative transposase